MAKSRGFAGFRLMNGPGNAEPFYLSDVEFTSLDVHEVASFFADWVVGAARHASNGRRTSSELARLDVAQVVAGVDAGDSEALRIRTRSANGAWWLHWTTGDVDLGLVREDHLVHVTSVKAGVRVAQQAYRALPEGMDRPLLGAVPGPTADFLLRHHNDMVIHALRGETAARVSVVEVGDLVADLVDPNRRHDLVLVTPRSRTGELLVNPGSLATRLAGVAEVVYFDELDANWAFPRALEARGFDRRFSCYDGGVRLYRPRLKPDSELVDHPLYVRFGIEEIRGDAGRMAGRVVGDMAYARDVQGWLDSLALAFRTPPAGQTAVAAPAPSLTPAPASASNEVAELRSRMTTLESDLAAAMALIEEANAGRESAERRAHDAARELRRAEAERDAARSELESSLEVAAVGDAVETAARLFGGRLVVHGAALKAATDSPFQFPEHVFRVLAILALARDETMVNALLELHFTRNQARWRPKDSDPTLRTFPRRWTTKSGEPNDSSMHVTLGGSERPDRHLQIYYDRVKGRVEVFHVGQHLPTTSFDT